jgi:hypothetical protein
MPESAGVITLDQFSLPAWEALMEMQQMDYLSTGHLWEDFALTATSLYYYYIRPKLQSTE